MTFRKKVHTLNEIFNGNPTGVSQTNKNSHQQYPNVFICNGYKYCILLVLNGLTFKIWYTKSSSLMSGRPGGGFIDSEPQNPA